MYVNLHVSFRNYIPFLLEISMMLTLELEVFYGDSSRDGDQYYDVCFHMDNLYTVKPRLARRFLLCDGEHSGT